MLQNSSDGNIYYETEVVSSFKAVSKFLNGVVVVVSLAVILGWLVFPSFIDSLPSGYVPFRIEVSFAFLLLSGSLLLLPKNKNPNAVLNGLSFFLSVSALLFGLIGLAQVAPAWRENVGRLNLPNLPFLTALNVVLLSLSLLSAPSSTLRKLSQFFGIVVLLTAFASFVRYVFGTSSNTLEDLLTFVLFLFLAISAIFVRPEEGITEGTASQSGVGLVTRRLMVTTALLPVLICYLILVGEKFGFYDGNLGLAFVAVFLTFMLTLIVWVNTNYLNYTFGQALDKERSVSLTNQFKDFSLQLEKSKIELAGKSRDLKEDKGRLKDIFDNSPNLVFIKNKQGFFEFINQKFETVFHVSHVQIRGKTGIGFFPRDILEGLSASDSKVFDQQEIVNVEERVIQEDGVTHTYFVTKFPLLDDQGKPWAVCGIGSDITDLKDYEDVLIQERVKKEAIIDSIGDGLIATDSGGRLILMNKACQEMLGWGFGDFTEKAWAAKVRVEDEAGNFVEEGGRCLIRALKSTRRVFCDEHYYVRKDGSRFPVAIIATPIVFQGSVIGAIETFRDISRERDLERAKSDFVFMVSHELKAPMTAIKGGLAVVLKGDYGALSEPLSDVLKKMSDYVGRLLNLVEDVLSLSRIESGVLKPDVKKIKTDSVILELVNSLKVLSSKKGLDLIINGLSGEEVLADPVLVNEVMTNLISNAIKFTDKGGVKVYSQTDKGYLEICVKDTGIGISPNDQGKLFKKFQQISTPKAGRPPGTGLGLYISREMARLMGGDLWVKSSLEGKGSVFAFSVPLADSSQN